MKKGRKMRRKRERKGKISVIVFSILVEVLWAKGVIVMGKLTSAYRYRRYSILGGDGGGDIVKGKNINS